jgi:hypothetical protein
MVETQPLPHGPNDPRTPPQFSKHQPAASPDAIKESDWERQRGSRAENVSAHGGPQQAFAGAARASAADAANAGNQRPQSGFSADATSNPGNADPAAGYYHMFNQNPFNAPPFGYFPFGPRPFAYPHSGAPPFWPPGPPPFYGFPPLNSPSQQGAPYWGMMPFGVPPFSGQSDQFAEFMRTANAYANPSGWWNMLRSVWSHVASWWAWMSSGISGGAPAPQNAAFTFDAAMRMAMTQAEVMNQMFLKMAEIFMQACKAYQAFAEQSWASSAGSTAGSTAAPPTPASPVTARPGAPIGFGKVKAVVANNGPHPGRAGGSRCSACASHGLCPPTTGGGRAYLVTVR